MCMAAITSMDRAKAFQRRPTARKNIPIDKSASPSLPGSAIPTRDPTACLTTCGNTPSATNAMSWSGNGVDASNSPCSTPSADVPWLGASGADAVGIEVFVKVCDRVARSEDGSEVPVGSDEIDGILR